MKEYKYKINGNSYKVTIGDIEDNIAHVEVNGTHYKVEMEKQPKATPKPAVVRPRSYIALKGRTDKHACHNPAHCCLPRDTRSTAP